MCAYTLFPDDVSYVFLQMVNVHEQGIDQERKKERELETMMTRLSDRAGKKLN